MTIKITNVQVGGQTERIEVKCPQCQKEITFWTHPQPKFILQRTCNKCGAILVISAEEED